MLKKISEMSITDILTAIYKLSQKRKQYTHPSYKVFFDSLRDVLVKELHER